MNQELFTQVAKSVSEALNTELEEIKPETTFRENLGAESIDMLDIAFEIEKNTGKELDFQEVVQFLQKKHGGEITDISIEDVVDYLNA